MKSILIFCLLLISTASFSYSNFWSLKCFDQDNEYFWVNFKSNGELLDHQGMKVLFPIKSGKKVLGHNMKINSTEGEFTVLVGPEKEINHKKTFIIKEKLKNKYTVQINKLYEVYFGRISSRITFSASMLIQNHFKKSTKNVECELIDM